MTTHGRTGFMKLAVVLFALVVAACAAPGASTQARPNGPIDCAKLAAMGVKRCPPANPALFNPKLVNDTHGQVSGSQFEAYARGYLRNQAYQAFARNSNQPALLRAGILTDRQVTSRTFGSDLQLLSQAASEGGHLTGYGPVPTLLRLVVLPPDIQSDIRSVGMQPTRLGWVATFGGPATFFIVAGPRFTVVQSVSSHVTPVQDLSWGVYHPKSTLGAMWQFYGDTGCSDDPVWQSFCEQ